MADGRWAIALGPMLPRRRVQSADNAIDAESILIVAEFTVGAQQLMPPVGRFEEHEGRYARPQQTSPSSA